MWTVKVSLKFRNVVFDCLDWGRVVFISYWEALVIFGFVLE